jgi:phosphoglycerol transferase
MIVDIVLIVFKNVKAIEKNSYMDLIKTFLLQYLGIILFFSALFIQRNFDMLELEQILFHTDVNMDVGEVRKAIKNYKTHCVKRPLIWSSIIFTMSYYAFPIELSRWKISFRVTPIRFAKVFFVFSFIIFLVQCDAKKFIQGKESQFIEENYVSPHDVGFKFPEKKRNFVLIVLESIENTFASKEEGGLFKKSAIPELAKLAFAPGSITFTHKEGNQLGGAGFTNLAHWSFSARFAMLSGLPYKFGGESGTIPGAYTLLDLLYDNGYKQYLVFGHNAIFMGIKPMYTQHGNVTLCDEDVIKEHLPKYKDMNVFWGLNDFVIIEYAEELLANLSKKNDPFTLILHTVDTHFPDGTLCERCKDDFKENYYNTLSCSSREITKFVDYIKKLDCYNDTTIAVIGDHLTMAKIVNDQYSLMGDRSTYNCIINSARNTTHTRKRKFNQFDWYPTLVTSLGIDFKGNRLGLGTDLFSGEKTLTEKIGLWEINEIIRHPSNFYNREFLLKPDDELILNTNAFWSTNITNLKE